MRCLTMGRGKKRKRELPMPPPAAPWDVQSEEKWWSLVDEYEETLLSYDSQEIDQKRIQELEDLLHAERCQRKRAQELVAKYEESQQRLLDIVVKEFSLPHPPEPMPHLTRLERKREMEKCDWIVVEDDYAPAAACATARTRAIVRQAPWSTTGTSRCTK